MAGKEIGEYVLDSLQIFFPWDDDFYTYLKNKGFGKVAGRKALPLVYSDNVENHTGKKESQRKNVLRPEYFGKTYKQVGWKQTNKPSQPIIPSEKPRVSVRIEGKNTIFRVIPHVKGRNEYHLEFSSMAAFGKMYSNWAGIYLSTKEFLRLVSDIKKNVKIKPVKVELVTELKQNQREEIDYVEVPVIRYEFSISEFEYANDYIRLSGYRGKDIPSLIFDTKNKLAMKVMTPVAKVGILHTTAKTGFDERKAQSVIKISQDMITKSKRGKNAKVKGLILFKGLSKIGNRNYGNVFILDTDVFVSAVFKLAKVLGKK